MSARIEKNLPRRALLGFSLEDTPDGARVGRLAPHGPAAEVGVVGGETIVALDGHLTRNAREVRARIEPLRAGALVSLRLRDASNHERDVVVRAAPLPLEEHPGCEVVYDEVLADGLRLRSILTRPLDAVGPLPWVMFVQGHGATSVESPQSPTRPLPALARAFALAGVAFVRIERPGTGDSEGPPLTELSLAQETSLLAAALAAVRALPGLDPDAGWLLAHSLGDVVGAELAARPAPGVRGLMIYGGGLKTWTEYFEANCRRQWSLSGVSLVTQERALRIVQKFHTSLLIEKRSLDETLARWPETLDEPALLGLDAERGTIRGRPWVYWRELYEAGMPARLASLTVPVLAAWGTSDWLSERDEHRMIADCVNEGQPGAGAMIEIAGADHYFAARATMQASYEARDAGELSEGVPAALLGWMRACGARP